MGRTSIRICTLAILTIATALCIVGLAGAEISGPVNPKKLLEMGQNLAEKTHYVEALDLFDEARLLLQERGETQTALYADVLHAMAESKIKGRLHQNFPAHYVKTALDEIQEANKIRERQAGILPQKMAEGYYLEGIIHKRFFRRSSQARSCFVKAVNIDPGSAAAKRELSELITSDTQ
ncbi:MAG: hypothetical protein AB1733_15510 [Thermodesulfobacteriota bacterium]